MMDMDGLFSFDRAMLISEEDVKRVDGDILDIGGCWWICSPAGFLEQYGHGDNDNNNNTNKKSLAAGIRPVLHNDMNILVPFCNRKKVRIGNFYFTIIRHGRYALCDSLICQYACKGKSGMENIGDIQDIQDIQKILDRWFDENIKGRDVRICGQDNGMRTGRSRKSKEIGENGRNGKGQQASEVEKVEKVKKIFFYGATLLSLDEARTVPKSIRRAKRDWWLRSQGADEDFAAFVENNGHIDEDGIYTFALYFGIRPALCLDLASSDTFSNGVKLKIGGYVFTIVCDGRYALCDTLIADDAAFSNMDGVGYGGSDVKKAVDRWYDENIRGEQVYRFI